MLKEALQRKLLACNPHNGEGALRMPNLCGYGTRPANNDWAVVGRSSFISL
jgi:hypothetical protein